jgi:sugar O-acyltransferase (sialic acid O-acetyltransferase NeuD family)
MLIYGAGGHARVIVDCLESLNITISGIVEPNIIMRDWEGHKIYNAPPTDGEKEEWIIAIGSNLLRKRIACQLQYKYGIARHSSTIIAKDARIGEGTVIFHRAVIQTGVVLGKHVIVNTAASVDHDCQVADFAHISPSAVLCGNVTIGEGSQVGANATIIPNISIGRWCIVGAGAVVVKDIPDFAVVVGNPGKIIKYQKIDMK